MIIKKNQSLPYATQHTVHHIFCYSVKTVNKTVMIKKNQGTGYSYFYFRPGELGEGVLAIQHISFRKQVHNYFTQESQLSGWYIIYTGGLGDVFITILHRSFRRRVHNYFTQEFQETCSQLFYTGVSVGGVVYILHRGFRRRVHNYFTQKVQETCS